MANFSYLLHDGTEAALVDPAWEVPRMLALAAREGVRVTTILLTHGHPDHVNGLAQARAETGARVVAHPDSDQSIDHAAKDGEEVQVGSLRVRAVHTPGHRFDAVCWVVEGTHVLTGDTLFVGECGRVDLPGSDPRAMHETLLRRLAALPGELVVLPGHDYGATPTSTLAEERRTNDTLQPRSLDEFLRFMAEP